MAPRARPSCESRRVGLVVSGLFASWPSPQSGPPKAARSGRRSSHHFDQAMNEAREANQDPKNNRGGSER